MTDPRSAAHGYSIRLWHFQGSIWGSGGLRRGTNDRRFAASGAEELPGSEADGWCDGGCVWQRVSWRLSSCFPSNKPPGGALYGEQWCCVGPDGPRISPFSSFDHSWNIGSHRLWVLDSAAPAALIFVCDHSGNWLIYFPRLTRTLPHLNICFPSVQVLVIVVTGQRQTRVNVEIFFFSVESNAFC